MAESQSPQMTMHERAISEAVKAAERAFRRAGIADPHVVVNVVWVENDWTWALGSRVPDGLRDLMAESLAQSAEEARDGG